MSSHRRLCRDWDLLMDLLNRVRRENKWERVICDPRVIDLGG
jgi:hypothetical protein